jgi:hypothetical protein
MQVAERAQVVVMTAGIAAGMVADVDAAVVDAMALARVLLVETAARVAVVKDRPEEMVEEVVIVQLLMVSGDFR